MFKNVLFLIIGGFQFGRKKLEQIIIKIKKQYIIELQYIYIYIYSSLHFVLQQNNKNSC